MVGIFHLFRGLIIGGMVLFSFAHAVTTQEMEIKELLESDLLIRSKKNRRCSSSNSSCNEKIQTNLAFSFQDETVFFHDYVFALLELQRDFPPLPAPASIAFQNSNQVLLNENALKIANLIFPDNGKKQKALIKALTAFIQAGQDYARALTNADTGGDPNNSIVKIILNKKWLPAARKLAKILSTNCVNGCVKSKINRLLRRYTLLLAQMIDLLSPRFSIIFIPLPIINFISNPDFSDASSIYEKARILASEKLAPLITKKCL